jgi:hypothetical protein
MDADTKKLIDDLYIIVGTGNVFPHLDAKEFDTFVNHIIEAVNILDKPKPLITCKYDNDNEHDESSGSTCPSCHGIRTWCESCRMWSSFCCENYGTCRCS